VLLIGGARAGLIAPDDVTFEYLKGRPMAPLPQDWDAAVASWKALRSDPGAYYDKEGRVPTRPRRCLSLSPPSRLYNCLK
jgi:3-isopropylmalate/(R)-2-methylmalate dehydratase large subunit